MDYDLGYFDDETCRLEPIENPFGPECYLCLRNNLLPMCPEWTLHNMAERVGFEPTCPLRDKTLSRRPRYDHFGTSPQRNRPRRTFYLT